MRVSDLIERGFNVLFGDRLNPLYHLVEIVRRPLVAAQPAAPVSYAAAAVSLIAVAAMAAGIIAYYRRRIVFAL